MAKNGNSSKSTAKTKEVEVLAPEADAVDEEQVEIPVGVVEDVEVLPAEKVEDLVAEEALVVVPEDATEPDELPVKSERQSRTDGGLVRYDALQAYLQEMRRYPRLTREEEHDLAVQYFKSKNVEAAYKLVSSNLWLVVKLARDYERAARSLLDLIQEGNIGLMEAVKNFDPYRGVRFPSYAVWWIKAYIIRYVIANWRLVKIGTTQAQRKLFFNLKKEKERLEREGFMPGPKLLAESLNVKESDIVEMEQRLSSPDVSVDAPLESDSESNLLSMLPSSDSSAEDILAKKEMQRLILESLSEFETQLNDKEKVIFRERMLAEEKVTLQDVSEKVKVSRERVRQLENRIRDKLKAFVTEKFGATVDSLDF